MKLSNLILLTLAISFPFSTSQAHHAYAAAFDMKSVSQIQGRVVRLELLNPHTSLYLEVVNEQGEVEDWVLEGPGKLALARRGWTDDMFEQGELITVHGNPSRHGRQAMWLDRVVRSDGTEFIDPLIAYDLIIEEQRRQQILQARQQLEQNGLE